MSNQQHPITPPPGLVQQWLRERPEGAYAHTYIAAQAAQWGANQELEACYGWAEENISTPEAAELRTARRPKPPSLKKQLLQKLERIRNVADRYQDTQNVIDDLRDALEALPND